jgi:hypothetical protein
VPQHWFNAFPPTGKKTKAAARPGALLIHFASDRDGTRAEKMAYWGEVARSEAPEWYRPYNETGYAAEIAEYWERVGKQEDMESICNDMGKRFWE